MGATRKVSFPACGPAAWKADQLPVYEGGGANNNSRSYDFTGATMPAGATLERASAGTRYDASGLLVVESGDVARFDYDPGTLALLGLLVEPQRTNFSTNSGAPASAFATAWQNTSSINAGVGTAPDGSSNAASLVIGSGNSVSRYQSVSGLTSGQPITHSIFVKDGLASAETCSAIIYLFGSLLASFDFATEGLSGNDPKSVEEINDGWFRLTIGDAAADSASFQLLCATFGSPGDGYWLWGSQLEHGTFPTSYIPTTGSPATRSADVLTLDIPDGDWDLLVMTPSGFLDSTAPVTVSGGAGYEFDWADLTGAAGQRHVLSVLATRA